MASWAFTEADDALANTKVVSSLLQSLLMAGDQPYVMSGACPDFQLREILLDVMLLAGVVGQISQSPASWALTHKGRNAVEVGSHLGKPHKAFAVRECQHGVV